MAKITDDNNKDQYEFTLDDALELVGSSNKYQYQMLSVLCIVIGCIAMQVSVQTYLFIEPELFCGDQLCDKSLKDWCNGNYNIYISPQYQKINLVTQFGLWCDRKFLITISESSYFLGSILGGSIMSYYADKYGRKRIYIISWGIATCGFIGILTLNSIYQYMIANFIIGFGATPVYLLNYVIINETCGQKFRQRSSIFILIVYSIVEMSIAGINYFMDDWRLIYGIFIAGPAVIAFISSFKLKETPSFYSTKKNIKMLYKVLDEIAVINNKQRFTDYLPSIQNKLSDQLTEQFYRGDSNGDVTQNYGIKDLFKYPSLRTYSVSFMIISFTLHLVYYGSQYSLNDISQGDTLYLLAFFMGLMELITYLITKYFILVLKRKDSLIISYLICIACCASFLMYGISSQATKYTCSICTKKIIVILLACLIRIFNSFGFALQGLYANEIFPTCVRGLGTGILFSVGVVGSFTAPYVIQFSDILKINPYISIGALSILGPAATLFLQETIGKKLEDEIQELKKQPDSNVSSTIQENIQKNLIES